MKRRRLAQCQFSGIICPKSWRSAVGPDNRISYEPVTGVFTALHRLVETLDDAYCFWPFEICTAAEESLILDWLTLHNFWTRTGIVAGNIQFLRSLEEARERIFYRLQACEIGYVFASDRKILEPLTDPHLRILISSDSEELRDYLFIGGTTKRTHFGNYRLTRNLVDRLVT